LEHYSRVFNYALRCVIYALRGVIYALRGVFMLLEASFTLLDASLTTRVVQATVATIINYNHNTFIVLATSLPLHM
jgi:hypothetical protein